MYTFFAMSTNKKRNFFFGGVSKICGDLRQSWMLRGCLLIIILCEINTDTLIYMNKLSIKSLNL